MNDVIRCRFAIVGGGLWGTSIAYHLADLGVDDVVIVERWDIADGSSWAAAGFVGQVRHRRSDVELIKYSAGLYAELESAYSGSTGWGGEGSLRISYTSERSAEFSLLAEQCTSLGVPTSILRGLELAEIAPTLNLDGVDSALWLPTDGSIVPEKLARMLASGATAAGIQVLADVEAYRFDMKAASISGLETSAGRIVADHYIVAAGMFTPQLIATAGIGLPLYARQANYVVSNSVPDDRLRPLPTVRVPDQQYYARAADSRIAVGATRRAPVFALAEDVPNGRRAHTNAITDLGGVVPDAERLIPALAEAGLSHAVTAFESATSDGRFIIGPTQVPALTVVAGGQGYGVAAAGGIGRAVARELVGAPAEVDLSDYRPSRFGSAPRPVDAALLEDIRRSYGDRYRIAAVQS